MTAFRFQNPLALLLLIPVTVCLLMAYRRQRRRAVLYSNVELLRDLPVTWALRCRRLLPGLRLLGLALIVVAIARPQSGREEFRVRTEGIAIEMCIDRSGSMQALDFSVGSQRMNRLDAVKRVFRAFVEGEGPFDGRPDDLIGLVSFGGFADALCPLTLDHGALLDVLDTVHIAEPIRDRQGRIINEALLQEEQATAIGDAIAVAVDRLKDAKAKSRVIVLLSDGENTAGVVPPMQAAEAAATFGIRIYSIGVGSTGRVPFPVTDRFGRQLLQPQYVRMDEETLKELAAKTGGRYFHARDPQTLTEVYAEIDQLEKTATEGTLYAEYRELFPAWMLPGVACILLEVAFNSTRFRSLP